MHRLSQGPSCGPLEAPEPAGGGGCPRGGTVSPDRLVLGALDCRKARTASLQRDSLHGGECAPAGQRHGAACSRSGHTPGETVLPFPNERLYRVVGATSTMRRGRRLSHPCSAGSIGGSREFSWTLG